MINTINNEQNQVCEANGNNGKKKISYINSDKRKKTGFLISLLAFPIIQCIVF